MTSNVHPDNILTTENISSKKIEKEIGGPKGPEPTRYGDWENSGRVSDF
jgi:hypothetical protein